MDAEIQFALAEKLLAMGDDELVLGHRDSEWCGYAPLLEEDIAFANLALDEIGHASLWYALLAELTGEDPQTYPDLLVYRREPHGFRSAQLVELPIGDWAFSMLRQYLFDAYEMVHLGSLSSSAYAPLAEVAAKVVTEERYHLRHTGAWVRRLGLGTQESSRRMQSALDQLWPHTAQLFLHTSQHERLVAAGFTANKQDIYQSWNEQVTRHLAESGLQVPGALTLPADPGRSRHTADLAVLVADLQSVSRLEEGAAW